MTPAVQSGQGRTFSAPHNSQTEETEVGSEEEISAAAAILSDGATELAAEEEETD